MKRSAAQDLGDVRFAGAGRLITTDPGALRPWQLEDGTSRTVLEDPWKKAWAIDVSRDGRYLSSAGGDREKGVSEVVFQDLETGEARTLLSHGTRVDAVALDPSGITGDADGVVRVGPVSGEEPHLLCGHEGIVYSVAVGPEGRWIALAAMVAGPAVWSSTRTASLPGARLMILPHPLETILLDPRRSIVEATCTKPPERDIICAQSIFLCTKGCCRPWLPKHAAYA